MGGSTESDDDDVHTLRLSTFHASDDEADDSGEDHAGDYSSRMDEILEDETGHEGAGDASEDDPEEEEGFVYAGVDAEASGGYREQLRDVLGPDHDEDELDEKEAEKALLHDVAGNGKLPAFVEKPLPGDVLSDHTPSTPSMSQSEIFTPPRVASPYSNGAGNLTPNGTPSRLARPFLHPTISRLRSYTPRHTPVPSSESGASIPARLPDGISPPPSHFSAISRTSSLSNLRVIVSPTDGSTAPHEAREVFRWARLKTIEDHVYPKQSQKATALLGAPVYGSPSVLAANGMVCLGTDGGRVFVFDFKQTLICVCGNDASSKTVGPVTALALSHDHTFLASGHAQGHIQLYDLRTPHTPARSVVPTSLAMVAAGKQEGHLTGSRIVSVGFVAGRHTAIVSADDSGLAFYHSLGKVLFVEATDTLRILGKYPDDEGTDLPRPVAHSPAAGPGASQNGLAPGPPPFRRRRQRKANAILAMALLPLGTTPHPTDSYQVVALLTPVKIVIVGLKPVPRTWFRRHRGDGEEKSTQSRWRGTMAWFPSVTHTGAADADTHSKGIQSGKDLPPPAKPVLVYSWENKLHLLRVSELKVKEKVKNSRSGKTTEVEVGTLVFEETTPWTTGGDVLALQWLNVNQIIALTPSALEVYDVHKRQLIERSHFDTSALVTPLVDHTISSSFQYGDSTGEVAHSVRVYKGKIFLLGQHSVQVGTLLTWADRILHFVQDGDFLSAIDLTRSYYVGEAPGNKNGLPESPDQLRDVVGGKMRELMVASARYAFAEERLTDATHITPDGRGVDRTALFEGLVSTCARACIALDDYEFLFEDLFQYYDDSGISRIFLDRLERFVLDGGIHHVPPRLTQRLIAMLGDDGLPERAEQVIWRIDPDCLDTNQAIHLCQKFRLYDALIYVYTRGLQDYVSPVVQLLGLIRRVQQYRKSRFEGAETSYDDETIEPVVLDAYKIFSYLADVLSGLTYPSQEPLPTDEALRAKRDVYKFIFFGRSRVWPEGQGGRLVLTADEEGGLEPTYPYLRLLLRFDTEAFLHALDIAFEDSFFNDKNQSTSRLVIVKILLEILSTPDLPSADVTLVNIFIARNVPKYSQFLQITPSDLHKILIDLAEDSDESTREDRQLAAEFLLSAYNPHQGDYILHLFEQAGFYRILRSWHRQDRQWAQLVLTYLHDPDMDPKDVFAGIEDTLRTASRTKKGHLPPEVISTIADCLPDLMELNVKSTAALVDARAPQLHERAVEPSPRTTDWRRFAYLRYLLGPPQPHEGDEVGDEDQATRTPSPHISKQLRHLYISLHCRLEPSGVISALEFLPRDTVDWPEVLTTCEENEVYDAVVWGLNHAQGPAAAMAKVEFFEKQLSRQIVDLLTASDRSTQGRIVALEAMMRAGMAVCLEPEYPAEVSREDLWLRLLSSQVSSLQKVSACGESLAASDNLSDEGPNETPVLAILRSLFHEAFASLMKVTSRQSISLPRLFKRLLDSATQTPTPTRTAYTEFRTILTTMLDSYRSDGDMLVIARHLLHRDVFDALEELTQERERGWAPSRGICSECRRSLVKASTTAAGKARAQEGTTDERIVVTRTGHIYHHRCLPPNFPGRL